MSLLDLLFHFQVRITIYILSATMSSASKQPLEQVVSVIVDNDSDNNLRRSPPSSPSSSSSSSSSSSDDCAVLREKKRKLEKKLRKKEKTPKADKKHHKKSRRSITMAAANSQMAERLSKLERRVEKMANHLKANFCSFCKKHGHTADDCRRRRAVQPRTTMNF